MYNFFSSSKGIVLTGLLIGIGAFLLQFLGNPANMGICVVCFTRDTTGGLGLHRAEIVQYIRPEIIGFVLGSFAAALASKEFQPQSGSSPAVRFVLGIITGTSALVFLGCPWRMVLRIAGGDLNAVVGVLGFAAGIFIGTRFFKRGYTLGKSMPISKKAGLVFPLLMLGLLLLLIFSPEKDGSVYNGLIYYSQSGPGSMHAPLLISLGVAFLVGIIAQRSRFCTMGAFRDIFLFREIHLFSGLFALFIAVLVLNLVNGKFNPGFAGQPIAHTDHVWNFLSMLTVGFAAALAGGCPGRQFFSTGEGNNDSATYIIGLFVGTAFAHNFGIASSAQAIGPHSAFAVILGLAVCFAIAFAHTKKR